MIRIVLACPECERRDLTIEEVAYGHDCEVGMNLCETCESNPKENPEGKWCSSCKDDVKESEND
jgi:hypothetical protein